MSNYYAANQGTISIAWPTASTNGTVSPYQLHQWVPLSPVDDPSSARDFRSLRDLTAVEWLRRQVEDVCLRAAMA